MNEVYFNYLKKVITREVVKGDGVTFQIKPEDLDIAIKYVDVFDDFKVESMKHIMVDLKKIYILDTDRQFKHSLQLSIYYYINELLKIYNIGIRYYVIIGNFEFEYADGRDTITKEINHGYSL